MIFGIDNGLSGAVVQLSDCDGCAPIAATLMPCMKVVGHNEIDGRALAQWVRDAAGTAKERVIVAIEECPEHAKQKSIMRSMAMSYGIIVGSIRALCPHFLIVRVRSGNAKDSWQRKMLGIITGDTKGKAKEVAEHIWPGHHWHKTKAGSEAMRDAALIAEFVRREIHQKK